MCLIGPGNENKSKTISFTHTLVHLKYAVERECMEKTVVLDSDQLLDLFYVFHMCALRKSGAAAYYCLICLIGCVLW